MQEQKRPSARTESIEVESSHCGMGNHPAVAFAVADRLAQPTGLTPGSCRRQSPTMRKTMKRFVFLSMAAALLAAGSASAQSTPAQSGPNNNAVNSSGQNNSNAPVAGRNSFTGGASEIEN
jgi:hypothetical protein